VVRATRVALSPQGLRLHLGGRLDLPSGARAPRWARASGTASYSHPITSTGSGWFSIASSAMQSAIDAGVRLFECCAHPANGVRLDGVETKEGTLPRARSAPPNAQPSGPYLQTAVLCEKVLHEQDGVLSLIRIIDRIISSAVGADVPDEMPPVPVNLTLAIVLKSGEARGSHNLRIALEAPSGLDVGAQHMPVLLEGDADRGVNVIVNFGFQAEQQGVYWFAVYFGDRDVLLTRVPLRIVYQPQRLAAGPTSAPES
jgi:hypothetical protein